MGGVLFELTLCPKRAVNLKMKSVKTFIDPPKIEWHSACVDSFTRKGNYNETRTIAGGLHQKAGDLSHRTRSQRMCYNYLRFKLCTEK